jgi:hypothetical protein
MHERTRSTDARSPWEADGQWPTSRRAWFRQCAGLLGATSAGVAALVLPSSAEAQVDLLGTLPLLSNGQIPGRYIRAGLGGQPTARAYGLIDAPFADVMRVLARFNGYTRLVPTLRAIRVESRQQGHALIHAHGRAPLIGAYDVRLNASIVGRPDGTHLIELRTPESVRPRMHIRLSLAETPSRRRTVVAAELSFAMGHVPHGMARRAHVNASIATVAAIRRRVRTLRDTGSVPTPSYSCPA